MNQGYVMRFYYGYDSETNKTHKKDVYLDLDYYFTPSNAWECSQNNEAKKQANQILEALNKANSEGKYPIAKTNPLSVSERNFIDWLSKATQEDGKYSDNTKKSYKALISLTEVSSPKASLWISVIFISCIPLSISEIMYLEKRVFQPTPFESTLIVFSFT